jgi:hypothetical protein
MLQKFLRGPKIDKAKPEEHQPSEAHLRSGTHWVTAFSVSVESLPEEGSVAASEVRNPVSQRKMPPDEAEGIPKEDSLVEEE